MLGLPLKFMEMASPGSTCFIKRDGWFTAGGASGTLAGMVIPGGGELEGALDAARGLRALRGAEDASDLSTVLRKADDIDASNLNWSRTVLNHSRDTKKSGDLVRPYNESGLTAQEIMRGSTPKPDPQGVPTALRWDTPGSMNGSNGTWELVVDTQTNTVVHFLFKSASKK
jgi:hypothetical protein